MSNQRKEVSPVSMITEQLSNFHLTEHSGIMNTIKSLDVKKFIFGKASALISFDTSKEKEETKVKTPNQDHSVFYAVNIPKKSAYYQNERSDSEKEEPLVFTKIEDALKVVKSHKHARFKLFSSEEDAIKFALQSSDSDSLETSNICLTPGEEEGLPSVKSQDLVKLRKAIEEGNENFFLEMVWENAKYLVNYHGDTPAILHEGFRYNALHVAARSKKPVMCQLVLDTLDDPKFFAKIYNGDSDIRKEKIHHILDQYLNNPDKRLGETPLHFASKFGCLDTVKILLSHPYCIKDKKNKYGETAEQTICTRCSSATETLRKSMEEAFKGLIYVPILRVENNVLPPCIGKPCTKVEIEQNFYTSNQSVNSPNLTVKAFAGPMSPEEANTFYKIWKNPSSTPQKHSYTVDEQKCIHKIRLMDTEKGLERAGRSIAKDLNTEWTEYWPLLEAYVNLASFEGLKMLESHLNQYYESSVSSMKRANSEENHNLQYDENSSPIVVSHVNPLCHYLNLLVIGEKEENYEDDVFYTPPSSPVHFQTSEYKEFFVNGSDLSRLDIDMYLAIKDVDIDSQLYPCIYNWKCFIRSKLKSFEENGTNPKSLTPLSSVNVPRLRRRHHQTGIPPRNLFRSSEETLSSI